MWALTVVAATAAYAADPSGGAASAGGAQAVSSDGSGASGAAQYRRHRRRHGRHRGAGAGRNGPPGDASTLATSVPGPRAKIVDGMASPPAGAPPAVVAAIEAGNRIVGKPYRWGGGHGSFEDSGYDCSGTVSYALHGAHLLRSPLDSSSFESWGESGPGQWITVFTNPGHAYMTVAGIRLDTSAADDRSGGTGARWRPLRHSNSGYEVRHPTGL